MRRDTPLPPVFLNNNICQLDAYALREQMTPQRTVLGSGGFQTRLSPVKARALLMRLDDALYGFTESGGNVSYLPSGLLSSIPVVPPPRVVTVEMIDRLAARTDPPARVIPPTQIMVLASPRTVTIHRVATKRDLTLLFTDEGNGIMIAVIGAKIHWDLEGLHVRFETPDGRELQT